jgi:tRNA-specific 2-thiouridylase
VGPREALAADQLEARSPVWCGPAPERGTAVGVQVRAHGEELPGVVEEAAPDVVRVRLARPVRAAAAGQTMALYAGTRVVGSATLTRASVSAARGL